MVCFSFLQTEVGRIGAVRTTRAGQAPFPGPVAVLQAREGKFRLATSRWGDCPRLSKGRFLLKCSHEQQPQRMRKEVKWWEQGQSCSVCLALHGRRMALRTLASFCWSLRTSSQRSKLRRAHPSPVGTVATQLASSKHWQATETCVQPLASRAVTERKRSFCL